MKGQQSSERHVKIQTGEGHEKASFKLIAFVSPGRELISVFGGLHLDF